MSEQQTRTVVIGLDGGNWELIRPWLEAGMLPNIQSVVEEGVTAESHSYLPPVTVPNWKCYSTGKNPGKLGVYRFDRLDTETREYVFHHSTDFDSAELWDYLNDEGYRTAVINMPTTYPPRPIDGVMVCGGPDARESEYRLLEDVYTYPEELHRKLEAEYNYAIHPKPLISSKDERGEEVDAIHRLVDARFRVAYDLFDSGEFDFLHVTSFYSNTLQHFFWRDDPVREVWQIFDRHVGRFLKFEDTNVVLMSDHGCNEIESLVYLNNWLQENGYLSLETGVDDLMKRAGITKERLLRVSKRLGVTDALARTVPERIQTLVPWDEGVRGQRTFEKIDWENTLAVANAQGLVYLTLQRDHPQYDELRERLRAELETMRTPAGRPVASRVHTADELYEGSHLDKAPDIVMRQSPGIHISEATGRSGVYHDTDYWESENLPPGMFAAVGPDVTETGDLGRIKISDIAPTILRMMGVAIPRDLDGVALNVCRYDCEYRDPLPSPHDESGGESDEQVRERLENLGYLN